MSAESQILPYQVSAYSELDGNIQASYQDLYTSALEIDALRDESGGEWPSVSANIAPRPIMKELASLRLMQAGSSLQDLLPLSPIVTSAITDAVVRLRAIY